MVLLKNTVHFENIQPMLKLKLKLDQIDKLELKLGLNLTNLVGERFERVGLTFKEVLFYLQKDPRGPK